jgi:hypothetical protein
MTRNALATHGGRMLTTLGAVLLLVGCAPHMNEAVVELAESPAESPDLSGPDVMTTTVERENWPTHVVHLPQLTVEHSPTYVTPETWIVQSTVRHGGTYPDVESAMELTPQDEWSDFALEVPYAMIVAAADVVMLPVRLIMTPIWTEQHSPAMGYERLPAPRRAISEEAAEARDEDASAASI